MTSSTPCCSQNGRDVRVREDGPILHLHHHTGMEVGPSVGKSVCFRQLDFWKNPTNAETDIWHMVQHMHGDRHSSLCWPEKSGGAEGFGESMTRHVDPVGHSIKRIAVLEEYEGLNEEETKAYEKLLLNTYHGDSEAVKACFDAVKSLRAPKLDPVQPVGTIGAIMGNLPVLQFALDQGAEIDRDLAFAIKKGAKKSGEMKDFYEKDFNRLNDIIESINGLKPPNYKPNVPDEWRRRIDEFLGR